MQTSFRKLVLSLSVLATLSGCRPLLSTSDADDESVDVQAPRKGAVAALLQGRDAKSAGGAVDSWALVFPTGVFLLHEESGLDRVADICNLKAQETDSQGPGATCLSTSGHAKQQNDGSSCVGAEYSRGMNAGVVTVRRALRVMVEVLCKAKGMAFVSPAKKPGSIDLADLKAVMTLPSGDRVSITDAYVRSEKQTKGMYHSFAKGNLIDRGIRFSYDVVHLPRDKWNKESGGRIFITEQTTERSIAVSAVYDVSEGILSLRTTRLDSAELSPDHISNFFGATTGLLDFLALSKTTQPVKLLAWPVRTDLERDFGRDSLKFAAQSPTDWSGTRTRILVTSLQGVHSRSSEQGCGLIGAGGKWEILERLTPAGMTCIKDGPLQRFVQSECFARSADGNAWTSRQSRLTFAEAPDCGIGTSEFNLELLNDDGNTKDVHTFDPVLPSLPGISPPNF